jgi:adenylate kinase family enzyme
VPVLGYTDAVHRPRRVLVAGTSGSGKTTLAGQIASVLDVPHVEIDGLFHGPDWVRRPTFAEDVQRFSATDAWVTEWQYDSVRPLLAERADLLVWLDLPTAVVMGQVVRRTLRRRLRRIELWNGNIEPPLHTIFNDREHIVRWAWSTRHHTTARVGRLLDDSALTVVRLRSRRQVRRWVQGPLHAASCTPR